MKVDFERKKHEMSGLFGHICSGSSRTRATSLLYTCIGPSDAGVNRHSTSPSQRKYNISKQTPVSILIAKVLEYQTRSA